tara:strand:- start:4630 stop:4950 length:321 start_codon:yes stop_codon:yes gene_type:complete
MASYSVSVSSGNSFNVARAAAPKPSVNQEKTVVAENLSELADVSVSDLPGSDNYVLTYDATLAKFVLVPADNVLSYSVADSDLPDDFITQLDTDLDDKIDLDGGTF